MSIRNRIETTKSEFFSITLGLMLIIQILCTHDIYAFEVNGEEYPFAVEFKLVFDVGGQPVFSIIQDKEGFIWLGSFFNGAVRFDGYSTKLLSTGPGGSPVVSPPSFLKIPTGFCGLAPMTGSIFMKKAPIALKCSDQDLMTATL